MSAAPSRARLRLASSDVIPTGNDWIAIPAISAADASIATFNVLSMRDRGLLEVAGSKASPVLTPVIRVNGKPVRITGLDWSLLEYWIPSASFSHAGLRFEITVCAPPDVRAFMVRIAVRNTGRKSVKVEAGLDAAWGALNRVTYAPVPMTGRRSSEPAAWVHNCLCFPYKTDDTKFCWSLHAPGGSVKPVGGSGAVRAAARKPLVVPAGGSAEAAFLIGAGVEEFSAAQSARVLNGMLDRGGTEGVIRETAAWCRPRTRTTRRPAIDLLMNRNLLFNRLFAWGRTIDTEELVGVTSRSPRYYVSAAWWDRDALLWSFTPLLAVDPAAAKEALGHALGRQLRNVGVHSRFIDGTVLEDGTQLDEAAAPGMALESYIRTTGDRAFLLQHRSSVADLTRILLGHYDPAAGLFTSLQDSQDENIRQPYGTYMNALAWKALGSLAWLHGELGNRTESRRLTALAARTRTAFMKRCVGTTAGSRGVIFSRAHGGPGPIFNDVPPGSLQALPATGIVSEHDPIFKRTYAWLHSAHHSYSNHRAPYGLPGSFRVSFTCCWSVADHLRLAAGRRQAGKILAAATWDGGIVCEGLDPMTARGVSGGSAFAAAAGYVAKALLDVYGGRKR